jgi:predicted amidohydrolase
MLYQLTDKILISLIAGRAHWEILLRSRAIETQCYVIAAAQVGRHNERRESFGHALVVDPWGDVVARVPAGPAAVGIAVADVDLDLVASIRDRMPIALHREAALKICSNDVQGQIL